MKTKELGELRLSAVAAVRSGRAYADVGREYGVSAQTVARWFRAAQDLDRETKKKRVKKTTKRKARATDPPIPDDPPPPADITIEDVHDTLAVTRQMLAETLTMAREARRDGAHQVAQRYMRDAADLTSQIQRLEKQQGESKDGLHISQEEIENARRLVRERVEALAERPLLCAHCSRKLSIEWGGPKAIEHDERNQGS